MALLLLLLLLAACRLASPAGAVLCSSAADGGACVVTLFEQTKCPTTQPQKLANYKAMRDRCCSATTCNNLTGPDSASGWSSEQCSCKEDDMDPNAAPSQSLTLSPLPIDCNAFNLTASWQQNSSMQGYRVAVYVLRSDSRDVIGCFCTSDPLLTNITLPSVCFNARQSKVYVELRAVQSSELIGSSNIWRRDCYSMYNDSTTRLQYCGPENSELEAPSVQLEATAMAGGLVDVTLTWLQATDMYFLRLTDCDLDNITWFEANTTSITLQGLNHSYPGRYNLKIVPYFECAGMYSSNDNDWIPCKGFSLHLPLPSPSLFTSVLLSSSSETSTRAVLGSVPSLTASAATSRPVPSLMASAATSRPGPSLVASAATSRPVPSLMASAATSRPGPSLVASAATSRPGPTTSSSVTDKGSSGTVIVPVLVAVSVAVVVVLALSVSLLAYVAYSKSHKPNPRKEPLPSADSTPEHCPSPMSEDVELHPYIITPVSNELVIPGAPNPGYLPSYLPVGPEPGSGPVLLLYSLQTSEDQKTTIHHLLVGGLAQYGIVVETPGTVEPRVVTRDWLVVRVKQARVVLLVCNQPFCDEWRGQHQDSFQIGDAVRRLQDCLNSHVLDKFAYVYFEEEGKLTFPGLIQHRYLISNTDSTSAEIRSIAKFVNNEPYYAL